MQMPMPMPAGQLQEHPMEAPEAAPAGVAQPGAILEANFQVSLFIMAGFSHVLKLIPAAWAPCH